MSFITSIGIAVPPNRFDQKTIAGFMARVMDLSEDDTKKLQAIFRASGIKARHSVLEDYGKHDHFQFYANTKDSEPFPTTTQRLEVYRQTALPLSVEAVKNCITNSTDFKIESITHLIVVSCTGMYAPGLDIDLIKSLHLSYNVQRTAINFMGCYAAFNAIKVADAICKSDHKANVLIVCTELCSLHFQKESTDDNLLANALFADGSASLIMQSSPRKGLNLKPEVFFNALSPNGVEHMAWSIGDVGFEMKLSSYVPDIIQKGIGSLTKSLLNQIHKNISDIKHFAIHPGGKRILEVIESELGLTKDKNEKAYKILSEYGNMSSPTVLFVLYEIFNSLSIRNQNEFILSFAFGPGLTLESMLLKVDYH